MVMRQHKVWCVCVAFCVERYAGLQSSTVSETVTGDVADTNTQ